MTDDINATKEFQSIEDVSQTQTIPTELQSTESDANDTKVFESVADTSQTQVLPTANDGQQTQVLNIEQQPSDESLTQSMAAIEDESQVAQTQVTKPHDAEAANDEIAEGDQPEVETIALQSVADVEEPSTDEAESTEPDAAEPDADVRTAPDLNVPLMEAFAQPAAAHVQPQAAEADDNSTVADDAADSNTHTESSASASATFATPAASAAPAPTAESETDNPKRSASVPTIIFGVLGMVIGAVGLVCGWAFPGLLIESFYIDPRILTAIICGAVGVILVIVAIIWAVLGSKKQHQTTDQ
ncbi:hypothetical protein [Bifidobacterium cebidarum]|uniref:Uncharacterized protein n=1 Tax=Bifidobacterium cebidarum TaxID=2650773 RepID=A0A6I1GMH8_9BIFI|nr:hypothetical protein [Bifidobacterium cebidarum]KAB7789258.1 hypothetical protein F7D08_0210 [Bifidobacterium cebidarum]